MEHYSIILWNYPFYFIFFHKGNFCVCKVGKPGFFSDGMDSGRYHVGWKNYAKIDPRIDADRKSYVYSMSRRFWERYGYSITGCAYHANSFYYRLEPVKPDQAEFMHLPAGTAKNGLKKVSK